MCDTQIIRHHGETYFAKNSDREPDEPQHVQFYPAVHGDSMERVRTTYIEIDQVPERHAVILSRPAWMWGAEMGVNEHGLVIGNEAIFSRVVDRSGRALLGMDILRLALERCRTAAAAIQCIDSLLAEYGQGGPAGYRDKQFRYDSSFIIADPREAWVLETAARHWVARRVGRFAAISNALSITDEFELHSQGLHDFARARGRYDGTGQLDFARAFDTRFMPAMGRARQRRACSLARLASMEQPELASMAANLRAHVNDDRPFSRHGNADVCMHAGGRLRPSQTTGSLLVKLVPDRLPEVYVTGTSAPCLSLFQPLSFDGPAPDAPLAGETGGGGSLWHRFEVVHRRALRDPQFCQRLRTDRDTLEPAIFDSGRDIHSRRAQAREWHRRWFDEARSVDPGYRWFLPYDRFWKARRSGLM